MKRPHHPNYDTAFNALGDYLKAAADAHQNGTTGTITENLLKAVIALDDCYAFDENESPFTKARPFLE